jgi:hypothetical protein
MLLKQETPRSRLADQLILRGMDTSAIAHPMEGFGRLAQALAGTYLRKKDGEDRSEASGALARGAGARPWIDPDTGTEAPNQNPTGGRAGAESALNSMPDNPYARSLAEQLSIGGIGRQESLADYEKQRGDKLTDAEALLKLKQQYPVMKGNTTPSNILEWEEFQKMTPEQKDQFLLMKRANPYLNLGGEMVQPVPTQPGVAAGGFTKTLPPQDTPETRAAQTSAVETAKKDVAAVADYPKIKADADYTISLLDKIVSHPGLEGVVGMPSIAGATRIPGTNEADFRTLLDQVQGQQFLQAFENLKGGGVITEVEGTKATQAIARMNTAQTEAEFKKGAMEFRDVIERARIRAEERAKAATGPQSRMPEGVTNEDIEETMRANNMTRQQVIERLKAMDNGRP